MMVAKINKYMKLAIVIVDYRYEFKQKCVINMDLNSKKLKIGFKIRFKRRLRRGFEVGLKRRLKREFKRGFKDDLKEIKKRI